jgi:hypothetical protein
VTDQELLADAHALLSQLSDIADLSNICPGCEWVAMSDMRRHISSKEHMTSCPVGLARTLATRIAKQLGAQP